MEGTFRGWLREKPFGFIVPDDASPNVFLHERTVSDPTRLRPGMRLAFDVEDSDRGRSARDVKIVRAFAPREGAVQASGVVRVWNERGFGFIEPEDGSPKVYVRASSLRVGSYLSEGDIVKYHWTESDKGRNASAVEVVGWTPPFDRLFRFSDLGGPDWPDALDLAENEPWEYKNAQSSESKPILRSYIRHTFRRVEETDAIRFSTDEQWAAFNTGLVTDNQEEIFALFEKNPTPQRQPWRLFGFNKASDWEFVNHFGSNAPPLANYFTDPSVLLYDRRLDLYINLDHVMENIDRFPDHLQSNPFMARQLLSSAEATTKKRVYRNYKTAIPQFFRDRGKEGSVQLLLPICLQSPGKADLALAVARTETGTAYRGSTILTLDMAYNNARLLARPDTEWLQP